MSIPESVNNLKAVMGTLPAAFNTAVAKKRADAVKADAADVLNGRDIGVVQTAVNKPAVDHAKNAAAHNLQASQVGTYTKPQVNAQLAPFPSLKTMPVSQYGDLGFLPVGATAFFEGATQNTSNLYTALNIEDDGSLVYLRNGTNGSLNGVYYMYSPNALDGALVAPQRTNKRYQPPYFPAGVTAAYVTLSGGAVIAGRCQNAEGYVGDYFISSTGGTFNDVNHQGCFISPEVGELIWDGTPEVFPANDGGAYIIGGQRLLSDKTIYGFRLWYISKAQLVSGGRITPTLLTGWTSQSWYGPRTHNELIVVADIAQSNNMAHCPMYYSTAFGNPDYETVVFHQAPSPVTTSAQDESGMIRVRVNTYFYTRRISTGASIRYAMMHSFTINPNARTSESDAGCIGPAVMDPVSFTYTGNVMYPAVSLDYVVSPGYNNGHYPGLFYHQPTGQWFAFNSYGLPDTDNQAAKSIARSGPLSKYEALHYTRRLDKVSEVISYPLYGSAIGGSLVGCTVVPGNRLLTSSLGRNRGGFTIRGLVLAERGAPGFTYRSKNNGQYDGYAPHAKRDYLTDLGLLDKDYDTLVSEMDLAGDVVLSGGHFHDDIKYSGPVNIDADLNASGSVSITPQLHANLKAELRGRLGIGAYTSDHLEIIVPQNGAIPAIGLYFCQRSNGAGQVTGVELSIASGSRTGAIGQFTVVSTSPTKTLPRIVIEVLEPARAYVWQIAGSTIICETTDSYLFGNTGRVQFLLEGTYATFAARFAIPKSTNRPDWSTLVVNENLGDYNTNCYTAIPGLGFGYNQSDSAVADDYTKLVFRLTARSLSDFNTWNRLETRVQVSQDVAQGWLVYFTQEIPFLLNNEYGVMPATTLNLLSVDPDPSNKEFLVYLAGSALYGYNYSTTNFGNAESNQRMYIGKIVTGDTSITTIDIQKVTRLGNYRISTKKQGKSIPATAGNPSEAAHLLW